MRVLLGIVGFLLKITYALGVPATFVFLTFFDGLEYNWWNWLIAIPIHAFLAAGWPIYFLAVRPFFGS